MTTAPATIPQSVFAASPLAWAVACVRLPSGESFRPHQFQARLLMDRSPRVLTCKSRQIGVSLAAAILSVHRAIHFPNSTVLVVSRDREAASAFLRTCLDIIDGLSDPPAMAKRGALALELVNASKIISQSSTAKTGRGFAADLVILDEAAYIERAERIYRALLPTLSRSGGTMWVISTPAGAHGFFHELWTSGVGWSKHHLPYTVCPHFTEEWAARMRPNFTSEQWASEYQADFAGSDEDLAFSVDDISAMADGWSGLRDPEAGHLYLTACDIGRRHDPTIILTIDITDPDLLQVVAFRKLTRAPYQLQQIQIEEQWRRYGDALLIDSTGLGDPVAEALLDAGLPVEPFVLTQKSKADALVALTKLLEQRQLKCGLREVQEELRGYRWSDQNLRNDITIALAIAAHGAASRRSRWVLA